MGPALDRYDDCMCVGLLSFSYVRCWPPSLSPFVPSALTGPRWRKHRCTQRRESRCATESKNPDLNLALCNPNAQNRRLQTREHRARHNTLASPPRARRVTTAGTVASRKTARCRRSSSNVTNVEASERERDTTRARASATEGEREMRIYGWSTSAKVAVG